MKKMMDANTAVANIAYYCSEVAFTYPITPSSPMAEVCDELQSINSKNYIGNTVKIVEMQSEAGVAGALHGSLLSGALTTTFTSSQGLLLMIPNMYKLAGELLPAVFHVSSRSIASHALNIFCDHSDVMAVRQTGFSMLCSNNAQESGDFALASHILAIKSRVPVLHFFDGFRTSHEIMKVDEITHEQIKKIMPQKEINEFKQRALSSSSPKQYGTAQNTDIFFQNRELSNKFYNNVPTILQDTFNQIKNLTGRQYNLFEFVGNENAENVIISLGSSSEVIEEYITKSQVEDLALIKIRLFRPFSVKHFVEKLPKQIKNIIVLDRTKENGSVGEPLYLDIVSALHQNNINANVYGGRYGLGGKEFDITMVHSIYYALKNNSLKNNFTIGINDDVTNLSLPIIPYEQIDNAYCCKFYGLGSDGTISANKNSIKIIGDNTDLNAQAFFVYDSKKSGSLTTSHLRISKDKILSHYLVKNADFIAIHNEKFLYKYDVLNNLKQNGIVLINMNEEHIEHIPNEIKYQLSIKNATLYIINANKLAENCGLYNKINTIMQTAFFKLTNFINFEDSKAYLKQAIEKTYVKYGEKTIENNKKAVDLVENNIKNIKVPATWKNINATEEIDVIENEYYLDFIKPILKNKGDYLPVSKMREDGSTKTDTSKFEKRNIATELPVWIPEKCIQCGQCAMVCPHAVIRPILTNDLDNSLPNAIGVKNAKFALQISPKDCTGCKNCEKTCPVKDKAIVMRAESEVLKNLEQQYNKCKTLTKLENPFSVNTIKGSQFNRSYFEFNGACAGCGETPYIKLITQLFGNRMIIANATGCSSIYGGSCPTCPYSKDEFGLGPSWANSLFEDNAEFGYGMKIASDNQRENFAEKLIEKINDFSNIELKETLQDWLQNKENANKTVEIYKKLQYLMINSSEKEELLNFVRDNLNNIIKKSHWLIGGDGWAYDIGFGGLDHILASGENVNILVLDTEVYSNTGGQSSKATPLGASAKFNKLGKKTNKKNLAQIAMTYKDVYVAQIALGADKNQTLKALIEAENYNGVSLIIAYSTCTNHGIANDSMAQMKNAVSSGYFHLFRYNPLLEKPFTLDSKEPTMDYITHALTEKRYSSLPKEISLPLLEKAKENSKELFKYYKSLNDKL